MLVLEAVLSAKPYSYVNGISNYIYYVVWGDVTYPSDFMPHFTEQMITYTWWD